MIIASVYVCEYELFSSYLQSTLKALLLPMHVYSSLLMYIHVVKDILCDIITMFCFKPYAYLFLATLIFDLPFRFIFYSPLFFGCAFGGMVSWFGCLAKSLCARTVLM